MLKLLPREGELDGGTDLLTFHTADPLVVILSQ